MPDFNDFGSADDYDTSSLINASQSTMQQAARMTGGNQHGWFTTLAGDASLGVMDLVDTVASSIPGVSRALNIQRGSVNRSMLAAVDMPGLTNFYNQNKEGIQVASGIAGIVASEIAGRKIAAVATPFLTGLKAAPFAKRVLSLDADYAQAMSTVRAVDMQLARTGVTGAEAWTTGVGIRSGVVTEAGPSMGVLTNLTRREASNKAFFSAFGVGVKDAARTEAAMATFLNQNEFLYSEDQGQNFMWMGLGVGLGGTFTALGAGYQMRKFVNSDTMRRIKADALDPTGQEAARTAVAGIDSTQKKNTYLGHLQGTATDKVTSLMVSAKAAAPVGVDATTFNRMASQHEKAAAEELTKLTAKGLPGQFGTGFDNKAAGFWNHAQGALHKDPGLFYGAEMAGGISDEMTIAGTHNALQEGVTTRLAELGDMLAAHDIAKTPAGKTARAEMDTLRKQLDANKTKWKESEIIGAKVKIGNLAKLAGKELTDAQKIGLLSESKNLRFQQDLTPMVLMDQELMPLSHGQIYDDWIEPKIEFKDDIFQAFDSKAGRGFNVGIQSDGTLFLPSKTTLDSADHFDVMRLYRSSQKFITEQAKRVGDPKAVWEIPSQIIDGKSTYSWFHLDMAEELLKRTDGRAQIGWGTLTRESAQKESLIQKIQALRGKKFEEMSDAEVQKMRLRYNLPRLNSYEMGVLGTQNHPLDGLIRGSINASDDELRAMSLDEFKSAYAQMSQIGDLAKVDPAKVETLTGNSFRFMLDDKGNPVKPILMYKRNIAPNDYTPDRLAERIGAKKTAQAAMLAGSQSGPITRQLTEGILNSPDYKLGGQTTGLIDTQLTSSIPGLANVAPQTATGSVLQSVVQAEFRARDNPVILAVTRLRETIDRQMRGFMKDTVESAMGDRLTVLNGPRNAASKALLDQFHTFRSGWDLEANTINVATQGEKRNAFVLAETQGNRTRWKQQYGTEMPKGQTLLDSRGREVVLDDLALDVQKRFNQITDVQRVEKNSLLAAQGLPQIRSTEWYVPPASVQGKYIGFTFDSANNIVPGGTVVANTPDAFAREVSRLKADPKSAINSVPGANFRNRDEIKDFASIWDRAQMEMMNPGTTAIQGGEQSAGYLIGSFTNVNRFDESMTGLRDTFTQHGDDLIQTMLDDQIKAAMSRSNIASGITRNADAKQTKYNSVYDYWLMAAKGQASLSSQGSALGWLYKGAEAKIDDVIRDRAPGANRVWAAATDWLTKRMPWSADARSVKQFEGLRDKLGEHMPFESAAEMIERRALGANPMRLSDLTGAGNRFTATWMLRILEPAAAVMNLAGIVNAFPSVIRHVSAKEGETAVELASRVGHSASIFTTQDGRVFSSADMGKIAINGFKRAWSRASDAEFDYMSRNGFLSQEVAEFQRAFNAVEDKSSWNRFFTGDPTSSSAFAKKGLTGWLSILTDKSEDFSRSWGHMIGLEVAEMSGITGQVAKHNFAHDIANKMIANYSPLNRPEVFQGAIGAPIGLFQTFMWNYYQRMFRYLETGDARAIATQYAVQGSLFGAKSTPGFNELNNLFFENSDGQTSPYDALYSKFGQSAGDLMMAGTLSNLPKLFGAEGVDLYSRGDSSPRILTQNPISNSPVVGAMSKIMGGIAEGARLFSDQNPHLSSQQVGEVLSNMIPNRPIAGFVEQTMAGGYDTDSLGQVVHQTKTWMDATYRMIGLRSLQNSKDLEAFYSNKQAQEISAAQQDQFRTSLRGAIRSGDMDTIPSFIERYIENGGDPRQVKRMLRSAYESALESRSERQLSDVIKNPNKMAQVSRLMDAQVGIGQDAETPDVESAWGVPDPLDGPMPTASEDSDLMAYDFNQ